MSAKEELAREVDAALRTAKAWIDAGRSGPPPVEHAKFAAAVYQMCVDEENMELGVGFLAGAAWERARAPSVLEAAAEELHDLLWSVPAEPPAGEGSDGWWKRRDALLARIARVPDVHGKNEP